jgi:type IV pilus secretin PilQ/predicted competence protein
VTLTRGVAVSVAVAALGVIAWTDVGSAGAPDARLKAISTRIGATGASLVIEATEPVPYVATRPDPLTVFLDFRNVATEGLVNSVKTDVRSPVARVSLEPADSLGVPLSRLRIVLTDPVGYRVRSDRNRVVIDFERPLPRPTMDPLREAAGAHRDAPPVDPIAALGLASTSSGAQPSARNVAADAAASTTASAGPTSAVPATGAPTETSTPDTSTPAGAASKARGVTPAQLLALTAQRAQPVQAQVGQGVQTQPSSRNGRTYSGNPVSLDFQQADLRAVLRVFSEISGLNMVIDPAVQGTVDVALRDVPWDQALDIILRANKLGYIVDGTVVRIAPLTTLADEEGQRRKLADEQALAGELRMLTRTLSYAKADEMQGLLTKSSLSQRGTVQVDPRTNTLIVTDLQERLNTVSDLLATLDRAQPQVEIEARIVQTNKNYARQLGVQWGFNGRVDPSLGNTTNLAFPNSGSLNGRVGPTQGPGSQPTAVNLGVGQATSAVGLALGSVNGAFNLDVALTALESTGNGRILSTPRVTTLNNVEAEVTQGVQIPLQTIANNTVTVTFKDAALTLKVTPQITAADTVIMKVMLENATPDFSRAAGPAAIPPINTQRALTTLLVNDGQTTVIGGIFQANQQNATDRTPGLGQIPILSWLFKRDRIDDASTELLIFITPRIVKG